MTYSTPRVKKNDQHQARWWVKVSLFNSLASIPNEVLFEIDPTNQYELEGTKHERETQGLVWVDGHAYLLYIDHQHNSISIHKFWTNAHVGSLSSTAKSCFATAQAWNRTDALCISDSESSSSSDVAVSTCWSNILQVSAKLSCCGETLICSKNFNMLFLTVIIKQICS